MFWVFKSWGDVWVERSEGRCPGEQRVQQDMSVFPSMLFDLFHNWWDRTWDGTLVTGQMAVLLCG